jgi:hypothetical protein
MLGSTEWRGGKGMGGILMEVRGGEGKYFN